MARFKVSTSARVGIRHRVVPANTAYNCITNSPDGASCARTIVPLAAGAFSSLVDPDGTDGPITAYLSGFVHMCDTQSFQCTADCVVYY